MEEIFVGFDFIFIIPIRSGIPWPQLILGTLKPKEPQKKGIKSVNEPVNNTNNYAL